MSIKSVAAMLSEDDTSLEMTVSTDNSTNLKSISEGAHVNFDAVMEKFQEWIDDDDDTPAASKAMRALALVIKHSKATTMMGLDKELKAAAATLKLQFGQHWIAVESGTELFIKFVTRTSLDIPDFEQCKTRLIERGESFKEKAVLTRDVVAKYGEPFVRDGMTVLTHGYSSVVLSVLQEAAEKTNFQVMVTESRPDNTGYKMSQKLQDLGIPVTLILDAAVANCMESVDVVITGAEGVVESGGIINKIGTCQTAIIASALKKPFYVAAESFKFARMFPLNQRDLPETNFDKEKIAECSSDDIKDCMPENVDTHNPIYDYTPPEYITLLFTDLGVLTPSAVSDELIKMYIR